MNQPQKTLLKLAREGQLPHPAKLTEFKLSSWLDAYEFTRGQGNEERGFLNAAAWLNDHFQRVEKTRQQFTFRRDNPLSTNELIQAHLGAANHAFYRVCEEQLELMAGQPEATMEQHLALKSSLNYGNAEADPSALNTYRLDSLCGAFWELFKRRDDLDKIFPEDRPHKLDKLTFLVNETSMVQRFHNFSRIWQDLLYGEAQFFPHPQGAVLASTAPDPHLLKAVSEYRRKHHRATEVMLIVRDLKNWRLIAEAVMDSGQYLHYQGSGNSLSCVPWEGLSEEVQMSAFYHRVAPHYMIDQHLHPILDSGSSDARNQTMRNVLNVWSHLAVLAAQIKEATVSGAAPEQWDELLAFAPKLRRDDLVDHLVRCTNMIVDDVKIVIEMLSYDASSIQDDLWSQPLLVLDEYICFAISALLTASIERNFDIWLKRIDPKSDHRGKLFERDILNVLQECRSNNPILAEHLCWTAPMKFRYEHKKYEEIDLTFAIGNLIVIAELRSRRTPITALDYHNELSDLNGIETKTNQARRKAERVRENLQAFCDKYYPLLSGRNDLAVLPLVIINGQFHAGYPRNGVPVLDTHLLKHFLKDAQGRFYGSIEGDADHMYSIPLYDCLDEAAQIFPDYARCPTLISVYNALITQVFTKYEIQEKDFPPIFTTTFEIPKVAPERYVQVLEEIAEGKLRKNF
ncbi:MULTISPECIES: hypothetical protein [unclassified Pseudomonas]|uniref:hypothetical protein n=1 Tax=unclassified Pseudomonas TaxID=196821 RepID=UPI000839A7CA|nr:MULTISPECIES: hypothetical protein [unclassified Pseudomonas]QIH09011.1 hypothetical protein ATY02_20875 [Pseudomonas sp. BIOMIG1BAC]